MFCLLQIYFQTCLEILSKRLIQQELVLQNFCTLQSIIYVPSNFNKRNWCIVHKKLMYCKTLQSWNFLFVIWSTLTVFFLLFFFKVRTTAKNSRDGTMIVATALARSSTTMEIKGTETDFWPGRIARLPVNPVR